MERPIELHRSFVRSYQKRIAKNARLAAQYKARVTLFASGVRGAPLYDHALTESKEGQRAFSISGDVRVVYIETPSSIVFLALDQQPIGLPQLAHDLLRGVAASLHGVLLPLVGWSGLSEQADQSQGIRSHPPDPSRCRQRRTSLTAS